MASSEPSHIPGSKDEGMGLDDFPLAVEGDVSLLPVVAEHLSQHVGGVEAHPVLSFRF